MKKIVIGAFIAVGLILGICLGLSITSPNNVVGSGQLVEKTLTVINGRTLYHVDRSVVYVSHISISKANWNDRQQEHYVVVTASFSPYRVEGGLSDIGSTDVFVGDTVMINKGSYILEDIDLTNNIARFSYWGTE